VWLSPQSRNVLQDQTRARGIALVFVQQSGEIRLWLPHIWPRRSTASNGALSSGPRTIGQRQPLTSRAQINKLQSNIANCVASQLAMADHLSPILQGKHQFTSYVQADKVAACGWIRLVRTRSCSNGKDSFALERQQAGFWCRLLLRFSRH
jgi:hypothetical protein